MNTFTKYYFLGIGGIGMSALARYFNSKGFQVAGYDRTETKLTKDLQAEGIAVSYEEEGTHIPADFRKAKNTLVVITPAVPQNNPQLLYFQEHNFSIQKRAEVFSKESNLVVIEADEYDRSFHQLSPYMAVITSADPDHLDIYETADAFRESFEHFTSLIRTGGALIMRKGIDIVPRLKKGVKLYTYSMDEGGDFTAENIRTAKGEIRFDFVTPTDRVANVRLGVPARINIENSVAAMALAWLNGVTAEELRAGISSFSGIYRRFNLVCKTEKTVYMDDYAHHPSELNASISSIRDLYPDRKITGIFQPHLYSRTRDFATAFADALSQLDELILLDIYPARELPMEGVSSELIFRDVKLERKTLCSNENLLSLLKEKELDVVVTFGAGDIDKMVPKIKELVKKSAAAS